MEILIVILLILLNGLFAMSELAIISVRKSRLRQQAQDGNKNAQAVLELSSSPNKFLSTTQIGITFISIFAGAFGERTITKNVADFLKTLPVISPYSETLSLILVVTVITYFSLVIGELVPKRLALNNPEKVAKYLARFMNTLSVIASPLIAVLSFSTDSLLKVFRIKTETGAEVSEDEVRMLIREGTRTGIFQTAEKDIVERTFRLSDKKVRSLMVSRKEIIFLDIDSSFKTIRNKISKSHHAYYPVVRDSLDKVLGVVRTEDILTNFLTNEKIDLKNNLHKPLLIPETMDGLKVLELFKKTGIHMALVINEYGNIHGLLSITDILEEIVGDIPTLNELEEKDIIKREDGTYLVDGMVSTDEFKEYFHLKKLPDERSGLFHTIGGFVMHRLGRIPVASDNFEFENLRFEVMSMDESRVDKILVSKSSKGNKY